MMPILELAREAGLRPSLYSPKFMVGNEAQLEELRSLILRGNWKPIDSAPKTKLILVGAAGRRPMVAEWSNKYQHWAIDGSSEFYASPTHWDDLPPSPPEIPGIEE